MCWKQIHLTRVKQIVLLGTYNSEYENEAKDFFKSVCTFYFPPTVDITQLPYKIISVKFYLILILKFLISVSSLFLFQVLEQKEVDACVCRMLCRPVEAV